MVTHKEYKRTWALFIVALVGIAVMLFAVFQNTQISTKAAEGRSDIMAQFQQWYAARKDKVVSTGCGKICNQAGFGGGQEGRICQGICVNVIAEGAKCENQCARLGTKGSGLCVRRLCPALEELITPTITPTP